MNKIRKYCQNMLFVVVITVIMLFGVMSITAYATTDIVTEAEDTTAASTESKQYSGATGLKTGSTAVAKYSLAATATRDNIDMIAVVLAAPDYKVRFSEATRLLDYGFANCIPFEDKDVLDGKKKAPIISGKSKNVAIEHIDNYKFICIKDQDPNLIEKKIEFKKINAPVKKGTKVGTVSYFYKDVLVSKLDIIASNSVDKLDYGFCLWRIFNTFICGS